MPKRAHRGVGLLVLLMAAALVTADSDDSIDAEQQRLVTPRDHMRKLLARYACNSAFGYMFVGGRKVKTIYYPARSRPKPSMCCNACKKHPKCWQWTFTAGRGGFSKLCELYDGSATMEAYSSRMASTTSGQLTEF